MTLLVFFKGTSSDSSYNLILFISISCELSLFYENSLDYKLFDLSPIKMNDLYIAITILSLVIFF